VSVAETTGTYYLELEYECGTVRDTIELTFLVPGSAAALVDGDLSCEAGEVMVSLEVDEPYSDLQWSYPDSFDPAILNDVLLSVNDPGYYAYSILFENGCVLLDSVYVNGVFDWDMELVFLPASDCWQSPSVVSVGNAPDGALLEWSTSDGLILSDPAAQWVEIGTGGTYTLVASAGEYCVLSSDIGVVMTIPEFDPNDLLPDNITCSSELAQLEFNASMEGLSYQWLYESGPIPGAEGDSLITDTQGSYGLVITDPNTGCEDTLWTTVEMDVMTPEVSIWVTDTLSCAQPRMNVYLDVLSPLFHDVQWYGPGGVELTNANGLDSLLVDSPGVYAVEVTDLANGCSTEVSAEVIWDSSGAILNDHILFPNVLTTDGDGLNAVWRPFLADDALRLIPELFDFFEFKVYNRWGTLLHTGNGLDAPGHEWRPSDQADEVCYYHVRYSTVCDPDQAAVEGYIHLIGR
jgi:hypothetical protein